MNKRFFSSLLLACICIYSCQKDAPEKFKPEVFITAPATDTFRYETDSLFLSGSATDKDGTIAGYLWSYVSGPSLPDILTPGLPETYITSLRVGTYVFQLMATDNEGLVGVAMDTITLVKREEMHTLVLNNTLNIHELLISGNEGWDISDSVTTELSAYNWTHSGNLNYGKSAFKFDFLTVPAGVKIVSAKLSLYSSVHPKNGNLQDANYGTQNALYLERITSNWNNFTTVQTAPTTDVANHISIPQSNNAQEDLIDIDVTDMVRKMMTDNNYGFMIRMQETPIYNSRIFTGSRNTDVSRHPTLTLVYNL